MPKDYRKTTRKTSKPNRPKKSPPIFHVPSFAGGIVVGGVLVVLGAFLPELLIAEPQASAGQTSRAEPTLVFEFPELLREGEIVADHTPYEADIADVEEAEEGAAFLIQAASFRHPADAETLRAQLLLQDMPVTMSRIALNDGSWYRVTVGPYDSQVDANRALTRLREQDLRAIMLKKPG